VDLNLAQHVVLVVGGSGLIGRAVTDSVRAEGATVITASRTGDTDIRMDGADDAAIASAIAAILHQHGRLDAVVITAAPSARTLDASKNSDPGQVINAFDAKAMTFLRVANAVIPGMRDAGYGRIIGVSGQNAFVTGNLTGSIRNAALIIAAKSLADELAGTGVSVVTVNPGIVSETPATEVAHGTGGESTPQQVADAITFLLSPRSNISGESIAVGHRVRGTISY
jgi:NAD(P)-dependent dehydrogenase (short-subunit alcohol dehydrogenase family)